MGNLKFDLKKDSSLFFNDNYKGNSAIFSNKLISNYVFANIISKINNMKKTVNHDIYVTKLPDFKLRWKFSGFFGQNHYQKVIEDDYTFGYKNLSSIEFDAKPIEFNTHNNKLFNYILNMKKQKVDDENKGNNKNIVISKNGRDLFEGELFLDHSGQLLVRNLKIAENNHKDLIEKPSSTDTKNILNTNYDFTNLRNHINWNEKWI